MKYETNKRQETFQLKQKDVSNGRYEIEEYDCSLWIYTKSQKDPIIKPVSQIFK